MTQPRSILPPDVRGVLKATGYRGKGKSWFVSMIENPALTAFFDYEKKGEGIHNQLGFGLYLPITEKARGGVELWQLFAKTVAELPAGKFTHVILDNTAHLEMALKAEVVANAEKYAKQFGMDANNVRGNKYGGQSGIVNHLISEAICNPLWAKGVQLISVTSHVKPRWVGGAQVANAYNIKGADRWDELSSLTLVLFAGENAPIPSALVMKEQLGELSWDAEALKFNPRRRLPYRLPKALFSEVVNYLNHPADLSNPAPGEYPTEAEMAPFREELSREQISMIMAEVKRLEGDTALEVGYSKPAAPALILFNRTEAEKMKAEGVGPAKIAQYFGLTLGEYLKLKV